MKEIGSLFLSFKVFLVIVQFLNDDRGSQYSTWYIAVPDRTVSKGKLAVPYTVFFRNFFIFRLHFDPIISKYDLSRQPVMILEKGKKNCPYIIVCTAE